MEKIHCVHKQMKFCYNLKNLSLFDATAESSFLEKSIGRKIFLQFDLQKKKLHQTL